MFDIFRRSVPLDETPDGAVAGTNSELSSAFAARQTAGTPIDQRWLATLDRLNPASERRTTEREQAMERSCKETEELRRNLAGARIEAAGTADLTCICLEEAALALGQALAALERQPGRLPYEPLGWARAIALWLAGSVEPTHLLRAVLVQFYGGQAAPIGQCLIAPDTGIIAAVRQDFLALINAERG